MKTSCRRGLFGLMLASPLAVLTVKQPEAVEVAKLVVKVDMSAVRAAETELKTIVDNLELRMIARLRDPDGRLSFALKPPRLT